MEKANERGAEAAENTIEIGGRHFRKSSMSPFTRIIDSRCVAVSVDGPDVLVVDTKEPTKILRFSKSEWSAFVEGVKNGEFDI
jgi:hypothetical protein